MRVLIFSGGNLGAWALSMIQKDDYIIGVDRGAYFLYSNGIEINTAIGDFDSVTDKEKKLIFSKALNIISCDPYDKNETDTEMAFNYALSKQPNEIVLLGVLGSRFDHSLANIQLLYRGLQAGIVSRIIDQTNEIQLVSRELVVHNNMFTNISLIPLTFEVKGITLEGFQYPLHNATLRIGDSLGISNILKNDTGKISLTSGILQVIKSNDF